MDTFTENFCGGSNDREIRPGFLGGPADGWTGTSRPYPRDAAIPALFEAWARERPGAVAVVADGETLTYAALNARANRLARLLARRGVGAETRVGVCVERGAELVVALLAVLKAGGAYVPLDPAYPRERLAYMAADAALRLVLADGASIGRLPAGALEIVPLDEAEAAAAGESGEDVACGAGPLSLAYVVYTSGSTGRPKGVMVPHRAVVRLVTGQDYCRFGPGEVFLGLAPVAFDASTFELWGALLNGSALALFPPRAPSLDALAAFLSERGVTTAWLTAGLFHALAGARPDAFGGLRQLLAGGDVVSPAHVRRVMETNPGLVVVNGYGPTEGTTFTACHAVRPEEAEAPIPIGRPLANTRAYVLGEAMAPAAPGAEGELYAGGDGVARGYLARPALTAERFVPDPFASEPGARLYRTGDRARWRADGVLEFLGRLDGQVKVRGHRVEPGEIEAALAAHPGVAQAHVAARADGAGEKTLAAYVVPAGPSAPPAPGALREHLSSVLPDYMVPAAVVVLPSLPLTPNGKVDRDALPAPEADGGAPHVAPRDAIEAALAAIWAEVLETPRVGVHDDLFALGAHSLRATRVAARVREALGAELPLRDFFEAPTVAGQALRVAAAHPSHRPARVRPRLRGGPAGFLDLSAVVLPADAAAAPVISDDLPLAYAQERVWFVTRLAPETRAYQMQATLTFRGALDAAALEGALGDAVRRHEAFRTTFHAVGGRPAQRIHAPWTVRLPVADLSRLAAGDREAEAARRRQAAFETNLVVDTLPLVRWTLLKLADDHHELVHVEHHIIHDGWSFNVFIRDLLELYRARVEGGTPDLPPLEAQFADFCAWQREWMAGGEAKAQLAFWKAKLEGAPALLELPWDRPRPAAQRFRGASESLRLPAGLYARLRALGGAEGASLFHVMLAAFAAVLGRWAGAGEVCVGTGMAARRLAETEAMVGMFVNTVVLRLDVAGDPPFRALVARARETALEAAARQDVPFDAVVDAVRPARDPGHNPLAQVLFSFHDSALPPMEVPGGRVEVRLGHDNGSAKVDLNVIVVPHAEQRAGSGPGDVTVIWEYDTGLFDASTLRRLFAHFRRLLEGAADDPGRRVSELEGIDEEERRRVVHEWNATAAPYPRGAALPALFEAGARRAPDALAALSGAESLSYGALNARANRLARLLVRRGVGPETAVGVCVERDLHLPVALLAVLKAGGVCVPLDPAHPAGRLALMLEDTGARLVLAQSSLAASLPSAPAGILRLEEAEAEAAGESPDDLGIAIDPGHLAYILFTSGSTGRPKGVMVPHRAVVRVAKAADLAPLGPGDRVAQVANPGFDVAAWEVWGALANGAALVAVPREVSLSPEGLAGLLRDTGVTALFLTTALFVQVARLRPDAFRGARHLLVGGEAVDAAAARRVLESGGPPARLVNAYGPTENGTYSTFHLAGGVDPAAATVPIGRAIANSTAYVLDGAMRPAPVGVPGELYVGGDGLARGYAGRPALTAERFVPHPFGAPGERLYRTGDRARWRPGGALDFLGRVDGQVKLRGFRIEPGEIEAALRAHPAVAGAHVALREDASGERRLVGYVVPAEAAADGGEGLRAWLRRTLPEYMVPAAFVGLGAIPLSPNGKVDRRALPAPEAAVGAAAGAEPRTELERRVAAVWAGVLGVERVGVDVSFFDLGGHSLLLPLLHARLAEALPEVELELLDLFRHPTVAAVCARARGEADAGAAAREREALEEVEAGRERLLARRRQAAGGRG